MLPFSPRLRIALATAEAIAKDQQRRAVTCVDILCGITSLTGGVADNLLKAKGFSCPIPAVSAESLNHESTAYSVDALQALSAAMVDAAGRSHTLIGIEDMLIGILSPPSPEISRVFAAKNINADELRSEVRKQI
jgi:ATP-dependent Clp protease ATP-binding subunit ClpA